MSWVAKPNRLSDRFTALVTGYPRPPCAGPLRVEPGQEAAGADESPTLFGGSRATPLLYDPDGGRYRDDRVRAFTDHAGPARARLRPGRPGRPAGNLAAGSPARGRRGASGRHRARGP